MSVFRTASANSTLRRVGCAYALFVSAEFGIWITLLLYAYGHGGASASTTIVLIQLAPCIVIAPFIGSFADRHRPARVLRGGYGLQAVALGGVAIAIGAERAAVGGLHAGSLHRHQPVVDPIPPGRHSAGHRPVSPGAHRSERNERLD